jgi:hypothetical protein
MRMAKLAVDEIKCDRAGYYRLLEENAKGFSKSEVVQGAGRDNRIGKIDRMKKCEIDV